MFFPQFNNIFTLTNAVGQCTKRQIHDYNFFNGNFLQNFKLLKLLFLGATNETLYEYCVCCGNKYNPDPSLGCPKNPWA